jgi:outer membrane protein assembly factor BamB
MKQLSVATLICLLIFQGAFAQTKVFKEVSSEISSQFKPIIQDGTLVGHLSFTELEKASEDSFNYRITIMDENLNDIGLLNFREIKLDLRAVSFEQDVLCLAYLKSNALGYDFKKRKEKKEALNNGYLAIFTQFISLDGKIIQTFNRKVTVAISEIYKKGNEIGSGGFKHALQLKNISGKGFVCFYGDNRSNNFMVFKPTGEQIWQKKVTDDGDDFYLLTSGHDIYLLLKKKETMVEGGYKLLGFNADDGTAFPKYNLKDKKGNALKVVAFENDPATGKPFLSGNIINPRRGTNPGSIKGLTKGIYNGVFTINLEDHRNGIIKPIYTYWNDGKNPAASSRGRFNATGTYMIPGPSFRDFNGNTYFTGTAVVRKIRWGALSAAVATAPLLLPPLYILGSTGVKKYQIQDAMLVRQDTTGKLSYENSIPGKAHNVHIARAAYYMYNSRDFYTVTSSDTKTTYLIVSDLKNVQIYNVNEKKVIRTIPHKDGNIHTAIYPAKEGHVIIAEYNKKERTTRFSIEAI